MKGFEDLGKEFNFRTTTMETNIPRARFRRSDRPNLSVWLKAEDVRNVMQVNAETFHIYFNTGSDKHPYVEILATQKEIDEFWGMATESKAPDDDAI